MSKKHHFTIRFDEGDEKVDFSKIENHTPKPKHACPNCGMRHKPNRDCEE